MIRVEVRRWTMFTSKIVISDAIRGLPAESQEQIRERISVADKALRDEMSFFEDQPYSGEWHISGSPPTATLELQHSDCHFVSPATPLERIDTAEAARNWLKGPINHFLTGVSREYQKRLVELSREFRADLATMEK